ncbi:MAG: family 20 glycosylhydrolase [Clostridia bacterium]|nr:family 20 glycosylhydrolase [Clostridia bacterium]
MYIGSLKKHIAGYRLFHRGTLLPFSPDGSPDEGTLFSGGHISYRQLTILNTGCDLVIDLDGTYFIDTLLLDHAEGIRKTELFIPDGTSLKCVAHAENGENPVAGVYANKLIARFHADFLPLILEDLDLTGAAFDGVDLYPAPFSVTYGEGKGFNLASAKAILCGADDEDASFAASYFASSLEKECGLRLPIRPYDASVPSPVVFTKDKTLAKEQYHVESSEDCLKAAASDRLGLLYAAAAMLMAVKDGVVCPLKVEDHPYKPFRGAHFGLPKRENIPFFKRLIRDLLVPMKYNTLFIEVARGMTYDSHPEINAVWNQVEDDFEAGRGAQAAHAAMVCGGRSLEKDEVRDIVTYAESFGLEVIPEIQSLSHVQYITMAHPEIGEVAPEEKAGQDKAEEFSTADIRPEKKHAHCYCAADERSYEILFDIADEVIDVFKPKRYVHMGHDEVYEIGVCEKCRDRDPAELFASDVKRIHDYLAKKGLKMMIWGDMLHDVTTYKTPPAIDLIPKDIILLDFIWYFHFDKDLEDRLLSHGFRVIMGNLYSSHYPRYASRAAKEGILGGQVSMWVDTEENRLAYEGKLYDMLYTAGMLWREGYNADARRSYDERLRPLLHKLRKDLSGIPEEYAHSEDLLAPSAAPYSVAGLADPYAENHALTFTLGRHFDALVFTHTADRPAARIAWEELLPVGKYVITYEDGTEEIIPIAYGGSIRAMNERHASPLAPPYYRHEGYIATYLADPVSLKDADGSDVTLYRLFWKNPSPGKKITSVTLAGDGETDVHVLLYRLEGLSEAL